MPSGPNTKVSMERLLSDTLTRVTLLERRLAIGTGSLSGQLDAGTGIRFDGDGTSIEPLVISSWRGTSAERDALFGVPATDAERVTLANLKVNWYNTDTRWNESYYAVTGLSGLAVTGLTAGTPSGWYPTDSGALTAQVHGGDQAMTSSQWYNVYHPFGTNDSWRSHGSSYFAIPAGTPDRVYFYMPGRYRIGCQVFFPNGSGTGVGSLHAWRAPGVEFDNEEAPIPLLASYGQHWTFEIRDGLFETNTSFANWRTVAATWTVRITWLKIEYLGPALVTA